MASSDDIKDSIDAVKTSIDNLIDYSTPTLTSDSKEVTSNHWHLALLAEIKKINLMLSKIATK